MTNALAMLRDGRSRAFGVLRLAATLSLVAVAMTAACSSGGPRGSEAAAERLEGQLEKLVITYTDKRSESAEYYLALEGGRRVKLVSDEPLTVKPQTHVRVEGERLDDKTFRVTQMLPIYEQANSQQALVIAGGPRRMLSIMAKFNDVGTVPRDVNSLRSAVFTGATSANAYFKEVSFGKVSLIGKLRADGDLTGWLDINASQASCDPESWRSASEAAAIAAGWDLNGYDLIQLFFNGHLCGWSGQGQVNGKYSWIAGAGISSDYAITHELGHNFSLAHANLLYCTTSSGSPVPLGASCTENEYGDPYDVMGSGAFHIGGYGKANVGWIPAANVTTVTANGTYAIAPLERPSTSPQLLRIQRSTDRYLYVEYRQPFGFDNFPPSSPLADGVLVKVAPDFRVDGTPALVDMVPSTNAPADHALTLLSGLTDPVSGVRIDVVSRTSSAVNVKVTFPTACTRSCSGKQCGYDGCGGNCGYCATGSCEEASGQCRQQCRLERLPVVASQASSVQGAGTPASAAFDRNLGTRWSSAASDPQWIYADLGMPRRISEVTIRWEVAASRSYQIEVSDDALSWRPFYYEPNGTGGVKTFTGRNTVARYVRMYSTARTTVYGNSIWELEISGNLDPACTAECVPYCGGRSCGSDGCGGSCGTCNAGQSCNAANQCVSATTCKSDKLTATAAVASSVQNSGTPASAAIDNNVGTRWSSLASDPQWLYVDLGASRKVNRVILRWEAAAARSYDIQVSPDATNWSTLYSDTAGTGGVKEFTGASATARYVRMYSRSRTTTWGNSLWELETYGDSNPSCTP